MSEITNIINSWRTKINLISFEIENWIALHSSVSLRLEHASNGYIMKLGLHLRSLLFVHTAIMYKLIDLSLFYQRLLLPFDIRLVGRVGHESDDC